MEYTKNWRQSKTIIAQIVAVIGFGLSMTGVVNVDEATQQEVINVVLAVWTIISQIVAIYWRIKADSKLK